MQAQEEDATHEAFLQSMKTPPERRTKVLGGYSLYIPAVDTIYEINIEMLIPEHVTYQRAYDAIDEPFIRITQDSLRSALTPNDDEIKDLIRQARENTADLESARKWLQGKLDTLAYYITEDLEVLPYYGPQQLSYEQDE